MYRRLLLASVFIVLSATIVAPTGTPRPKHGATFSPGVSAAAVGPATVQPILPSQAADPAGPVTVEIDCDMTTDGIQSSCTYAEGTTAVDIGVVLVNYSAPAFQFAANFMVVAPETLIRPLPGADFNLNANPDFSDPTEGAWACTPPLPAADNDPSPSVARSFLSCFNATRAGPLVSPGTSLLIAIVHYEVIAAGEGAVWLEGVGVGDVAGNGLVECDAAAVGACADASIVVQSAPSVTSTPPPPTATPTPWPTPVAPVPDRVVDATLPRDAAFLAVDCAPAVSGIQTACGYPSGTGLVVVDIVLGAGPRPFDLLSLSILAHANQQVLQPRTGFDAELNANPDFADLAGPWRCTPPVPSGDVDPSPDIARSFLDCINAGTPVTVASGGTLKLASVYYDAADGTSVIDLYRTSVGNLLGSGPDCNPTSPNPGICIAGAIVIGDGPLPPTPTATPTATSTPTATATPRVECVSVSVRLALIRGILKRLGAREGQPRYHRRYDVTGDGVITSRDLVVVGDIPACPRRRIA